MTKRKLFFDVKMKTSVNSIYLVLFSTVFFTLPAQSQGKYIPVSKEHFTPFVNEECEGIQIKVPMNAPWYVFSDKQDNPVYTDPTGQDTLANTSFGKPFLVTGRSEKRLQVIEADKVVITLLTGQWDFRPGFSNQNVVQGWMNEENLLLNSKCLKTCTGSLCDCITDIIDLKVVILNQGNEIFFRKDNLSVHQKQFPSEGLNTRMGRIGIGYVFKIINTGEKVWYLVGTKPEIDIAQNENILTGWISKDNAGLWKHKLALEYDWEKAAERYQEGKRLSVSSEYPDRRDTSSFYRAKPFMEQESCYFKGVPSGDYYFQRTLGTGLRYIILSENQQYTSVNILKNSANADSRILDPALAVANQMVSRLQANDSTIQEKLDEYLLLLSMPDTTGASARKNLDAIVRNFTQRNRINVENIDKVTEWVVRYLKRYAVRKQENYAVYQDHAYTDFDFMESGFIDKALNNPSSFKLVILLTNNDLDKIIDFADNTSRIRGGRTEIQKQWYHCLMINLGLFQDPAQVNSLTLGQATAILTGFKGSPKYENIRIGELTQSSVFPDQLMYEYLFEWMITGKYLQSVKTGTWQLNPNFLKSQLSLINMVLKSKKLKPITYTQTETFAEKLIKRDIRPVNEYFRDYPSFDLDAVNKVKAYWIEADFFSHEGNDFVDLLLSVVR